MAKLHVDFEGKSVNWDDRPKYWWKVKHGRRIWYRESRKHGYHTDGDGNILDDKKRTIAELKRSASETTNYEPFYWEPAKHNITTRETLKTLDSLVDQAEEKHREKAEAEQQKKRESHEQGRKSEKKDTNHPGSDRRENAPRSDARAEKSGDAGQAKNKRAKQRSSVSFAFKSEVSDYVLNFRAAPSKKQKGLYNVAIHLGSKFLGYVDVRPEMLGELGRQLIDLSEHATPVAD
jgi:hypothetical protein